MRPRSSGIENRGPPPQKGSCLISREDRHFEDVLKRDRKISDPLVEDFSLVTSQKGIVNAVTPFSYFSSPFRPRESNYK